MLPNPAFDQSPPASSDARQSYAGKNTVYYSVYISPTAEVGFIQRVNHLWITPEAKKKTQINPTEVVGPKS